MNEITIKKTENSAYIVEINSSYGMDTYNRVYAFQRMGQVKKFMTEYFERIEADEEVKESFSLKGVVK